MFEAPRQFRSAAAGNGNVAVGLAPLSQIDLEKIWSTIWRGRGTILLTTLAALVLAVLFIALAPHQYTAVTQILIDPSDLRAVGNETTASNQMTDGALLQVESQVQVLTSDAVLRRVGAVSGSRKRSGIRPRAFAALGTDGQECDARRQIACRLERTQAPRRREACRAHLRRRCQRHQPRSAQGGTARQRGGAGLSRRADRCARRGGAAGVAIAVGAAQRAQGPRARAEDRVEVYRQRNNLVAANGHQLVTEQQITDLNNQLATARTRTAEAKARLDQVEAVQRKKDALGAFPEAIQSPTITALRSQYAEIVRREADPAVIEIEAQAERLRGVIDTEINRIALSARGASAFLLRLRKE